MNSNHDISVIASDASVVGDLIVSGVVRVEGRLVGNVRADGQVLVASGGHVDGDIDAKEAVIGGEVSGPVRATERVDVQASAVLHGTITTPRLAVEEGAALDVDLCMAKLQPALHQDVA